MSDGSGRLVSIVDDDESVRRSVSNLLRSSGYSVETFESAEAFLEGMDATARRCLVLDVRMAGMSGLDLLGHLKAGGVRIPAVILTAFAEETLRRRAMEAGAVAYLTKPFRAKAILAAVAMAVARIE